MLQSTTSTLKGKMCDVHQIPIAGYTVHVHICGIVDIKSKLEQNEVLILAPSV